MSKLPEERKQMQKGANNWQCKRASESVIRVSFICGSHRNLNSRIQREKILILNKSRTFKMSSLENGRKKMNVEIFCKLFAKQVRESLSALLKTVRTNTRSKVRTQKKKIGYTLRHCSKDLFQGNFGPF